MLVDAPDSVPLPVPLWCRSRSAGGALVPPYSKGAAPPRGSCPLAVPIGRARRHRQAEDSSFFPSDRLGGMPPETRIHRARLLAA
jgi:hypothetical protein